MSEPLTIDCHYLAPELAASYLLLEGDEAAFIETNTAHALPHLLSALAQANRRPEQVRYIIVTHAHLDHAGGAWALLQACPQATVLAHPRAAPHLADPTKLVSSATKVYGEARFRELYGELQPIPQARLQTLEDEAQLNWGSRTLRFLHTRGHANHHFCVLDSATGGAFTGDAFGLRYPALQQGGLFVVPSTSPTDFDANEARRSVTRLAAQASRVWPTHFGELREVAPAAQQLLAHLDFAEQLLEQAARSPEPDAALDAFCQRALWPHVEAAYARGGRPLDDAQRHLLELDVELNAQGIAHVARRRRAGKA